MAVVQPSSYSSDSTPSLETSICCIFSPEERTHVHTHTHTHTQIGTVNLTADFILSPPVFQLMSFFRIQSKILHCIMQNAQIFNLLQAVVSKLVFGNVATTWSLSAGAEQKGGDRVLSEGEKQLYCFARQRRVQKPSSSKLCPDLRGDNKGFYKLSSDDRVIDEGVYIIFPPQIISESSSLFSVGQVMVSDCL